ncbi:GDSL-type esterase/lipase family protein [Bifidobacterium leontopitheci]|uniref:Internalin n=1 Tax=Bifidobacterium leontopitheci TaxID=2650774 RepID=A0A6I1GQS5_9BIFI|nr:GDSL-type esterase/lipase family protein [Bifidobacterium leontopitheci]KAB7790458.1 internalin [Bifidobacterium leontopitheci]
MTLHQSGATDSVDSTASPQPLSRRRPSVLAGILAAAALLLPAIPPAHAADTATTSSQPIDVIIGDSSATNFAQGVAAEQRWTKLFADADGARELNVAVGGTGFVVGGANTFDKQLDRVLDQLDAEHIGHDRVRRVFVVGGGNDVARNPDITRLITASSALTGRVKAEFPKAQRLYIPDASPATKLMLAAYGRVKPFMPYMFLNMQARGFQYEKNWYAWLPNAESHGYAVADNTHLSVAGHNEMAHMVAGWVNSLDGPKVSGDIPEYETAETADDVSVRFQADGGTGMIDRLTDSAGDTVTLPSGGFTQSRQRIVAWNTAADGSGTSYRPGASVTLPSHSLMLYAQWGTDKAAATRAAKAAETSSRPLHLAAIGGVAVLAATATVLVTVHRRRGRRVSSQSL